MWALVPLKEKRKYQLVESLFDADEPLTIKTLSELTESSTRGIRNYLNEIHAQLKELGGQIISSTDGIELFLPRRVGIDLFRKNVFKQTIGFAFLETIFFDETLTNTEMEEKLFISSATLHRLVNKTQRAVRDYGLTLESNPFRLEGDERLVRYFFSMYFLEAYSPFEWPFYTISKATVDQLLPDVLKSRHTTSDIANLTKIRFDFALGATRSLNGHSLVHSQERKNLPQQVFSLKDKRETELKQQKNFEAFASIYAEQSAYLEVMYSKQMLEEQYTISPSFRNRITDLMELLHELSELYDLPLSDPFPLAVHLNYVLNFYANFSHKKNLNDYLLFKQSDSMLVPFYEKEFPLFISLARKGVRNICKKRGLVCSKKLINHLLHLLFSQWEDLTRNLVYLFESCTLLVYGHLHHQHMQNIKAALSTMLNQALEITAYDEPCMDKERLATYDFDILVVTSTIPFDIKEPIVFLRGRKNGIQYGPLRQVIKETVLLKKQTMRTQILQQVAEKDSYLFKDV